VLLGTHFVEPDPFQTCAKIAMRGSVTIVRDDFNEDDCNEKGTAVNCPWTFATNRDRRNI
jgi:hypothetical protein